MNGTISKIITEKGFGFILGDDNHEYFVHRSALGGGAVFEQVREGQTVTFDAGKGEKGPRAETYDSRSERVTRAICVTRNGD